MTRTRLLILVTLVGCAGTQPRPASDPTTSPLESPPAERVRVDGSDLRIRAEVDPVTGLQGYDARDLFELASDAYDREEFGIARVLYARLIDEFPDDVNRPRAHWNYALACERQGFRLDGVPHLLKYIDFVAPEDPPEAANARLHLAKVLQRAGDFAGSLIHLERLLRRRDVEYTVRWEVRAHAARAWTDAGRYGLAEDELEGVRGDIRRTSRRLALRHPYHAAMVWHFAGELYRVQGERMNIDDTDDITRLRETIHRKAGDLLEARGHYKRALQIGREEWSGPSARAIGGIMEHFRLALLNAPEPSDLDGEAREVYRELVEDRTRQFLEKATEDYEWVLRDAERLLITPDWVKSIEQALARCRSALRASEERAAAE